MTTHTTAHQHGVIITVTNKFQSLLDGGFVKGIPWIHILVTIIIIDHSYKFNVDTVHRAVVQKFFLWFFTGQPNYCFEIEVLEKRLVDYQRLTGSIELFFHRTKVERRYDSKRRRLYDLPRHDSCDL